MAGNNVQANVPLNAILVGRKGCGKSSVGNLLLKKKTFPVPNIDPEPVTRYSEGNYDKYQLGVIDTPGLADCDVTNIEKSQQAIREIMSSGFFNNKSGIHLFIFVIKFGDTPNSIDNAILNTWRLAFGVDVFKMFGVMVMSYGDEFVNKIEETNRPDADFRDWCKEQSLDLKKLFDQFGWRIVLSNTREDDENRRNNKTQEVIDYVEKLRLGYTYDIFKSFKKRQKVMTVPRKIPQVVDDIKIELMRLKTDLEQYSQGSNNGASKKATEHLQNLLNRETGLLERLNYNLQTLSILLEMVDSRQIPNSGLPPLMGDTETSTCIIL